MTFAQRRWHARVWTWLGAVMVIFLVAVLARRPPILIQPVVAASVPAVVPSGRSGLDRAEGRP